MNNSEPEKSINNNEEPRSPPTKPTLCQGCFEFFGNPNTEGMCSKCYRDRNTPLKHEELEQEVPPVEEEVKMEEVPVIAEPVQEIPEPVNNQSDHSKCWSCTRKVGMMGYKCKCEFTFCKVHRLPEEHECSFDFQTRDRLKLANANPVVKGEKVQKI
eukprot:TRINITY_DN306_c0_g2_i2.p1 TRINITY_DN306_c0_g2~~TRINITY_DN306_c0_g2_i2.p1  ORF type:complete len:157 (-),score=28.72 TRINITY_DN306_c0_g2_i2:115-585(-)